MKTRTKFILILIPILLAAIVVLRIKSTETAMNTRRQNVPIVKVEAPKRESIVQTLELTGDLVAVQQADVFARVYGNLESVKANIGDYVKKDQVLAVIDTVELAQQYREASATYDNANSLFTRVKTLMDRGLTSQQDFDNAQTALKVAQATFENARTRLQYAQVAAPFSGFITHRFLDAGALLTSNNATLFTLADLDVMKVIVNVLERDLSKVNIGTAARVVVDAYPDKEFSGSVVRQSEALDLATRTMAVEVDIPNRDRTLKPGMFASVRLILDTRDSALTVPTQVILKDDRGPYVYVAQGELARKKSVVTGTQLVTRTEITQGLVASDKVIVLGQQFVKDSGQIRIQPQ
jgi:RND family efflux transporter MFP subunit